MNVGLLYTTASIYQMLRGSIVLTTGILSFLFLRRTLYAFQWIALLIISIAIAIVGLSPLLDQPAAGLMLFANQENPERALAGTLMILLAQLFTASQFIIEEKILSRYHVHPMEAIGYEGTFGLLFLLILVPPIYFFHAQYDPESWFNVPQGWAELVSSPYIWASGIGCIFSIAAFNGSALEVTKRLTATSRSTVDACRTVLIWGVSLGLGWERVRGLQVCGFLGGFCEERKRRAVSGERMRSGENDGVMGVASRQSGRAGLLTVRSLLMSWTVLLYGTFTFNGIIPPPKFLAPRVEGLEVEGDKRPLLEDEGEEASGR